MWEAEAYLWRDCASQLSGLHTVDCTDVFCEQKVWILLDNSQTLFHAVKQRLPDARTEVGFRYGAACQALVLGTASNAWCAEHISATSYHIWATVTTCPVPSPLDPASLVWNWSKFRPRLSFLWLEIHYKLESIPSVNVIRRSWMIGAIASAVAFLYNLVG